MLILFATGGLTGNASVIFMILVMLLFAICVFYQPATPDPRVSPGRLFAAAFFFWSLAIVIQMFGGL